MTETLPPTPPARAQDSPESGQEAEIWGGYGASEAEAPLDAYLLLMALYITTCATLFAAAKRDGRELPERIDAADILLIGMASQKLSRLVTSDWITGPIRAPFTRFERAAGAGEVVEEPRGSGLQQAFGQLLTCPFCFSVWVATCLTFGITITPRVTRLVSSIFAVVTVADFLQMAYGLTKKQAKG